MATCVFIAGFLGCAGEPLGPCDPDPKVGQLGTICGFQNPEDIEVVASLGALVVSEMSHADGEPGSLSIVDLRVRPLSPAPLWPPIVAPTHEAPTLGWLDADCTLPPPYDRFSPHGISAREADDGTVMLAVVSHGPREAIEVFELDRSPTNSLRARWLGCLRLPARTIANDVIFGDRGALLTTRYRPSSSRAATAYYNVVAGLGGNTGEVLRKFPGGRWNPVANSDGATPNGLLESSEAVYFAQTGPGSITAVSSDGSRRDAPIEGHPDNLSWTQGGAILAVSHTEGLRFVLCSLGMRPCQTSWALFEIAPETLRARIRLEHDGSVLGAAASVAQHEGLLFLGSVFGDRIGVLRESGDR